MTEWYYKQDEAIVGPVSRAELDFLLTSGRVNASTPIRQGKAGNWVTRDIQPKRPLKRKPKGRGESSVPAGALLEPVVQRNVPPKAPEDKDSTSPVHKLDPVKRQLLIGTLLAIILLFLIAIFWDRLPDSGSNTGNEDAQASSESAATANGNSAAQSRARGSNDRDPPAPQSLSNGSNATTAASPDQTGTASSASGDRDISSSTTGASDSGAETTQQKVTNSISSNTDDPDLSSATDTGTTAAIAGDPTSKFTISAPGEATFFGVKARGRRFTFVVDRSSSMSGSRLMKAKQELTNCVQQLPKTVEVRLIFFDDRTVSNPGGYTALTKQNLASLLEWIDSVTIGGGTSVKAGMTDAFLYESPGVIFLLTDGEFERDAPMLIRQRNSKNESQINTIALESTAGGALLKQIATENNGDYKYVP